MFVYEKRLQYPVNIRTTSATLANAIVTQLGGPDGELGASMRYLNQRFAMPYNEVAGVLTDIGREAPEMFRGIHSMTKILFIAHSADSLCLLQRCSSILGGEGSNKHQCYPGQ